MDLKMKKAFKPFLHPVTAPVLTLVLFSAMSYGHWWKMHKYGAMHAGPMPYIAIWCATKDADKQIKQRHRQEKLAQIA